jgi:hypothetical protein
MNLDLKRLGSITSYFNQLYVVTLRIVCINQPPLGLPNVAFKSRPAGHLSLTAFVWLFGLSGCRECPRQW